MIATEVRAPGMEQSSLRGGGSAASSSKSANTAGKKNFTIGSSRSSSSHVITETPDRDSSLVERLRNDDKLKHCVRVKRASMLCLAAALDSGFASGTSRGGCIGVSALSASLSELCVASPENQSASSKLSVSINSVQEPESDEEKKDEELPLKSILRAEKRSPRRKPVIPKSVRWDGLKLDDHAVVLDYNPGGISQKGPSVSIGWEVLETQNTTIDEFEATRGPRRTAKQLKTSKEDREQILMRAGYKKEEIQLAEDLAQAIRASREKSAQDFSIVPQPNTHQPSDNKTLQASGNTTTSIGSAKPGQAKPKQRKAIFRRGMFYR